MITEQKRWLGICLMSVYLTRNKKGQIMNTKAIAVSLTLVLATGCSNLSSDHTSVVGAGEDDLLKLRAGPSLEFSVILGLPDGTSLNRHACVTEMGQLWCRVSLTAAPQVKGYVSADYLTKH